VTLLKKASGVSMRPYLYDSFPGGKSPQGPNPGLLPLPAIPFQVPVPPSKLALSIQLVSRSSLVNPSGRAAPGKARPSRCESRIPMAQAFSRRGMRGYTGERLSMDPLLVLRCAGGSRATSLPGGRSLSRALRCGRRVGLRLGGMN